ncbi:MAG: hypothetical protein SAK29_24440 [Scytonema sp. PMC 1069.18]|nr:hypothetical protein [Scytonema sp. PMC 1069.18]MEC4887726.1 hypothetical protein [Scytonema sp. PMC 1070.18]
MAIQRFERVGCDRSFDGVMFLIRAIAPTHVHTWLMLTTQHSNCQVYSLIEKEHQNFDSINTYVVLIVALFTPIRI